MIKRIKVNNFRSLHETDTELSALTVIVGANSSGKSNLIKALEFLSQIPKIGLESTIMTFGGGKSILPKYYTHNYLSELSTSLSYDVVLQRPADYPEVGPDIIIKHELNTDFNRDGYLNSFSEKIDYQQAILLALTLRNRRLDYTTINKLSIEDYQNRSIIIERKSGRADNINYGGKNSKEIMKLVLEWLGMGYLSDTIKSPSDFKTLLKNLERRGEYVSGKKKILTETTIESILDPSIADYLSFSTQVRMFQEYIDSIRRYDFLQDELRKEQSFSAKKDISSSGKNMPTALRHMWKNSMDDKVWKSMLSTLVQMNPYINSAGVGTLQSGKEFVEFVETKLGRKVESWEASDGTLRGLAIILALETQPQYSTVIFEEPEQNLHPWAIKTLMEYIRSVMKRRNLQVILTTHSQQILENIDPDELIVATRSTENGTKLSNLKEMLPNHSIEMGEVGRMWVKGLLGGVPSYE